MSWHSQYGTKCSTKSGYWSRPSVSHCRSELHSTHFIVQWTGQASVQRSSHRPSARTIWQCHCERPEFRRFPFWGRIDWHEMINSPSVFRLRHLSLIICNWTVYIDYKVYSILNGGLLRAQERHTTVQRNIWLAQIWTWYRRTKHFEKEK